MALSPRDIPITREQIHEWLSEYDGKFTDLRPYLQGKVDELNLGDDTVDHPNLPGDASVVDLILADLGSYV